MLEGDAEQEEADEDRGRGLQRQAEDRVDAHDVDAGGVVELVGDALEEGHRHGEGEHRVDREHERDERDDESRRAAQRLEDEEPEDEREDDGDRRIRQRLVPAEVDDVLAVETEVEGHDEGECCEHDVVERHRPVLLGLRDGEDEEHDRQEEREGVVEVGVREEGEPEGAPEEGLAHRQQHTENGEHDDDTLPHRGDSLIHGSSCSAIGPTRPAPERV